MNSRICVFSAIPTRKTPVRQPLRMAVVAWVLLLLLLLSSSAVKADQSGDFTYTSDGASIAITGYTGAGGDVSIPVTINSLPVTGIGSFAFGYSGVSRLFIPGSITSIGDHLFQGSSQITKIDVAATNPNYSSVDGVLFNKDQTTLVQYPPGRGGVYSIPASVTSIGKWAFEKSVVRIVTIPVGVTSLGMGAFSECQDLVSMVFMGDAPTLETSALAETWPTIYYYAGKAGFSPFWMGFQTAVVTDQPVIVAPPEYVTITSGNTATLMVMALGAEPLTYQWYQGVPGNTSQPVGLNSPTFTTPALTATTTYWVSVKNAATVDLYGETASARVTVLSPPLVATGFPNHISGTSATLTGTVNPNYSATTARFEYGLTTAYGSTANVVLAPNDGSTTQNVEAGLGGLQEGQTYHYRLVATNSAGTSVGDDMTLVTDERSNGFHFAIVDGTVTITGYFGNENAVNIPTTINGLPVTRIGEYAFYGRSQLDRVTIPDGVITIGNRAFYSCSTLWEVTIPDSVTRIGDEAFGECWSLSSINIPNGVTGIGNFAFLDCRLASIVIPASVTSIGDGAFGGCSVLTRATFMGNAPAMGVDVFMSAAMGFGIRNYGGATGFTTPTWMGYPSLVGAPDMALEQAGLELTDGGVLNCGAVRTGTAESRLITIRNTGVLDLTGLVLSIDGTNSGNFAVGPLGKSSLAPGESTTFGVTFSPTAGGIRAASLHVARSATDANPFDVMLTGTGLSVTDGGTAPWTEQSTITHGRSAASRSGSITHSQESWMQTTVTGPGTLTFWWKVSSQASADYLEFYQDGVRLSRISGEIDWELYALNISAGAHTVKWRYMKNATTTSGQDAGWLDEVAFFPGSFVPVVDTGNATGITASTATLNAVVNPNRTATTAQFQYGLSKDYGRGGSVTLSPNTGSATVATSVNISGLQPGWTYHYRLVATNASGTSLGADRTFATEASSGSFKFTMSNGAITISGYTGPGGAVSIPATINEMPVTGIGANAFFGKTTVSSVSVPASVTNIGSNAFYACSGLSIASFLGNAPMMGANVFGSTASGFTVNYFDGAVGFTKPTWNGYPSAVMGATVTTPTFANVTDAAASLGGTVTSDGGYTIATRGVVYAPTAINNSPRIGGAGVTNMPGTGTTGVFMVNVGDLMPGTAYTFAVYATNSLGTGYGVTDTFTTLPSPFTFSISGGVVEITGYTGPGGTVDIPGKIGGQPVTRIGDNAFSYCTGLTSVTIPNGVTSIGDGAFYSCMGLTSVVIPDSVTSIGGWAFYDCAGLTSVTIPSSVSSIGDSTFDSCTGLTGVTIPNGVTSIGYGAFFNCSGLTGVTIPDSVTRIGDWAFYYCRGLKAARYMGNAPTMGNNVFAVTAGGFTVYHFDGATGFTSPPWTGYTLVNMGAPTPISTWLVENTLPHDLNLQDDPNGDGVNLLMAYALDLNPNENLSGSMPEPVVEADRMSLDFHAGSAGVTYAVETSTDMVNWTTDGVILTAPDANQIRTASVDMTGTQRYMRIVVVR